MTETTLVETYSSSKKELFRFYLAKEKKILIFCPENYIALLSLLFDKFGIDVTFNKLEKSEEKDVLYLHYASKQLSFEIQNYLIKKVNDGLYVRPLVDYLDRKHDFTFIELLNSDYFLHHKSFSLLRSKKQIIMKRVTDIFFSSLISIFTFPLFLVTMIAIKLESKGPIFYLQERIGKFNSPFKVIKFRSMRTDAEKDGAKWAAKNDDRVTKVGKFIRATRIDEIPQLINVFKGEMSLIGPRPERSVFIKELEKEIPYYSFRHAVRPGLTGWAQVNYPYGASVEDAKWKHRYDMFYIKHQSFWLDFKIILKTIKVVLFGMGR